jgi:hypothetical protein
MDNRLTRQHRPQGLPAEDMDMEVRDLLSGTLSGVGKQAITLDDELLVPRDFADGADEAGDLFGGR